MNGQSTYNLWFLFCQYVYFPFSLLLPFLLRKTELAARKQGHGAEKVSAGKEFQPETLLGFRRMGRAARAPSRAPLHRKTPLLGERTACPPGPRNDLGLMVFPRQALASGPGMA